MYGRLSPFVEAIPDALREDTQSEALTSSFDSTPHRRRRRRKVEEGDGWEPDYESGSQDVPRFVKGERVTHPTFGSGSVVAVSGFGRDTKVTVDFDEVGRKKLLVRYAELEKDWTG